MFGHIGRYGLNGFYGNGYGFRGFGFGHGFFGGFSQLFFLILIGVVIYLLIKLSSTTSRKRLFQSNMNTEAKEIVKLRYARGEISLDEYQKIMDSLN